MCISKRCPSYAFRCIYGACVSRKAECDGKRDCADNSDELSPKCTAGNSSPSIVTSRCGEDKFQCTSGQCISSQTLCDGRRDCSDGSDEVVKVCAGTYCPSYGFRCGYGGCVHANAKCNGKADCADGTDENEELCGRPADAPTTEAPLPRCSIRVPSNGRVFYESAQTIELFNGSLVEDTISIVYHCRPGYSVLGANTSFCLSGEWTSPQPSCIRFCPQKELLSVSTRATCDYKGITIECNSMLMPDTIARISCAFGYKRVNGRGSDIARCRDDGQWDTTILQCEQICGTEAPEGVSYIVGGDYTNNTKVPWHVAIYNDLGGSNRFVQSCGGTILSNRVVISAAHCFWDKSEGRFFDKTHFRVVTGKYYRDWNAKEPLRTQKIAVQEIRAMQGYRDYEDLYNADLALLVLSVAIEFRSYVIPICMEYNLEYNDKYVTPGSEGRVAGWGLTESGGKSSEELKVIDLPVIEVNQCKRDVPPEFRSFVTTDKFCAGYTDGQSVCQGDSGGGLVFPKLLDGVNVYFMRGIVSSGPNSHMSCASDKYTVFTNVHFYASLILDTVRRNF